MKDLQRGGKGERVANATDHPGSTAEKFPPHSSG
jgi:hypothetical protein